MILDLHRQGLTVTEISRRSGLDRKTVRRYIARRLEPSTYGPRQPRPTLLDPFTCHHRERVQAYSRADWLKAAPRAQGVGLRGRLHGRRRLPARRATEGRPDVRGPLRDLAR